MRWEMKTLSNTAQERISAVTGVHFLHGVRQLEVAVRATVGNSTDYSVNEQLLSHSNTEGTQNLKKNTKKHILQLPPPRQCPRPSQPFIMDIIICQFWKALPNPTLLKPFSS